MLPKARRVSVALTRTLPDKPIIVSTADFLLRRYPGKTRFACAVPKRLDKRATRRNRTKRLILEAIHLLLPKVTPGFDVVISAKKILWTEKVQDVLLGIEEVLNKGGLLH